MDFRRVPVLKLSIDCTNANHENKDKGVTNLYNINNQSYKNIDDKIIENFITNLKI